jgi:hypothetical protein
MILLQYTEALRRTHVREVKGLSLHMPNDLFNGSSRLYSFEGGEAQLQGVGSAEGTYATGSRWLNIDGRLGVFAAYGSEELSIYRPGSRQIGLKEKLATAGSTGMLYADEICGPCRIGLQAVDAGQVIVDAGFVMLAGEGAASTRAAADGNRAYAALGGDGTARAVYVTGADGNTYVLAANFGEAEQVVVLDVKQAIDVASGEPADEGAGTEVEAGTRAGAGAGAASIAVAGVGSGTVAGATSIAEAGTRADAEAGIGAGAVTGAGVGSGTSADAGALGTVRVTLQPGQARLLKVLG